MKKILFALFLCLLLPSCERLELPDGTDGSGQTSAGMGDESLGDTLSVAQAQRCPNDTLILVEGYIVGYINGTSMTSGATFSLPKSSPNSNMLLADAPDARELGPVKGDVAFSHVSFSYEPGAPEEKEE